MAFWLSDTVTLWSWWTKLLNVGPG